jgi:hypothetical protein
MFEIPQEVFDTYELAVDAMIDTNFGVSCRLLYPAELTVCTNCLYDSINGRSTNIYNGTGPIPFSGTTCPYCDGNGSTESQETEDIMLRCYFTPKNWIKFELPAKIPSGSMQTIGHIADLPKCRRCVYMIANVNQDAYLNSRYRLFGEPQFHGFKKKDYFVAYWTRLE